jgi:hypothetical protein
MELLKVKRNIFLKTSRWIGLIGFILVLSLILTSFLALLTLPKYFLIENFISKKGVFILSKSVKEEAFSVIYKDADVFYRKKKILKNLSHIKISYGFFFPHLEFSLLCKEGGGKAFLRIDYKKDINLQINNFACLEKIGLIKGNLLLTKGILNGSLLLKNVNMEMKFYKLELNFINNKIRGKLYLSKDSQQPLIGEGEIKFQFPEMNQVFIDMVFKGKGGMSFHIKESLKIF